MRVQETEVNSLKWLQYRLCNGKPKFRKYIHQNSISYNAIYELFPGQVIIPFYTIKAPNWTWIVLRHC